MSLMSLEWRYHLLCWSDLEDFIKPGFADFSLRKTRGLFTYALAPFLTNITSHIERILVTLSEQIDKFYWADME
jgi:hypothetical protein